MLGAGFLGAAASRQRRARRNASPAFISAAIQPASSLLTVGQSLSDSTNWASFLDIGNYSTSASGESIDSVLLNYIGDTSDAATVLADGDTNHFSVTVTDTGGTVRTFMTVPRSVVYTAPAVIGSLADQSFTIASGIHTYDVTAAFTGPMLSYSLTGLTGGADQLCLV